MNYGLIGHPLRHSFSCEIHSLIGDYGYELKDLEPEDISIFFAEKKFNGINVTIPYKKTVIPYLDYISEEAKSIGSVNTVVNRKGKLYGYNTDIYGFSDLMNRSHIDVASKKILLLGSGGSSETVKFFCKNNNSSDIITVSRHKSHDTVSYEEAKDFHSDADIIINTTPVGMYPDNFSMPIDLSSFPYLSAVADIVYNPLNTGLILSAQNKKINSCNGLYMLVSQAVHSAALFFDDDSYLNKIDLIYKKILKNKTNFVFIGMPASGKSTIGNIIAKEFNRSFFDSDVYIENKQHQTITEIFKSEGEYYFRCLETETISDLSKLSGCVISTGGGVVLNPQNIRMLRQNGMIIFLDKSVSKLFPDRNRPLASTTEDIKHLYAERISLYRDAADIIIKTDNGVDDTVNKIKEILNNENLYN